MACLRGLASIGGYLGISGEETVWGLVETAGLPVVWLLDSIVSTESMIDDWLAHLWAESLVHKDDSPDD